MIGFRENTGGRVLAIFARMLMRRLKSGAAHVVAAGMSRDPI
jgi:hypothetical protein